MWPLTNRFKLTDAIRELLTMVEAMRPLTNKHILTDAIRELLTMVEAMRPLTNDLHLHFLIAPGSVISSWQA